MPSRLDFPDGYVAPDDQPRTVQAAAGTDNGAGNQIASRAASSATRRASTAWRSPTVPRGWRHLVHGWAHNLQISNNRITQQPGTLAGGIAVGQENILGAYLAGAAPMPAPGSCQTSNIANTQLPYCFDRECEHSQQRGHGELFRGR